LVTEGTKRVPSGSSKNEKKAGVTKSWETRIEPLGIFGKEITQILRNGETVDEEKKGLRLCWLRHEKWSSRAGFSGREKSETQV